MSISSPVSWTDQQGVHLVNFIQRMLILYNARSACHVNYSKVSGDNLEIRFRSALLI